MFKTWKQNWKHRRRYPESQISADAIISKKVNLGEHCLIGSVHLLGPISIGRSTMFNGPSFVRASVDANCSIGSFCSIASGVTIRTTNHPLDLPTTFSARHKHFGDTFLLPGKGADVVIKNDVWIGTNAVVLPGVTISDGAVVGAGAVVTKNVAPYCIVGGIPAKPIRYRFVEPIVEMLLKVEWWNWPDSKIFQMKSFFRTDLNSLTEDEAVAYLNGLINNQCQK